MKGIEFKDGLLSETVKIIKRVKVKCLYTEQEAVVDKYTKEGYTLLNHYSRIEDSAFTMTYFYEKDITKERV